VILAAVLAPVVGGEDAAEVSTQRARAGHRKKKGKKKVAKSPVERLEYRN